MSLRDFRDGLLMTASILLYCLIFSIPYCFGQSDACLTIIRALTPKGSAGLKLTAFINARKDKGSSALLTEAPVNYGLKLEIPLIDKAEEYRLRKELLTEAKQAQLLLSKYLELKSEIDGLNKYITWLWERVEYGIEYRKEVWPKEIELSKKKARLKSLIKTFKYLGISETLLNKCYMQTSEKK